MATSRTGTNKWKNLRKKMLYKAKRNGSFVCVDCGITLDETAPRGHPQHPNLDHRLSYRDHPELQYEESNLVWRCEKHNKGKSARTEEEHVARLAGEKPDAYDIAALPEKPREGRWYPGATTGVLNAEGFVVGWLAEQRLFFMGRWFTEAEAIAAQKEAKAARAENPFKRD